jgi:hypothetical protein
MGLRNSPLCRKCGAEDETSVHILCRCEALASSRRTYLGSFVLEPRDIHHVSLGAIWRFGRAVGLPWENEWGTKGRIHIRPECIGAKRPRTPCQSIYLSTLQISHFIYFEQIYILNFLNMLHTLHFFSSNCCLFHNATFFGSCIIHILRTGCAKI